MIGTGNRGAYTRSDKGYVATTIERTSSAEFAWQARASWVRTHFTDFNPDNWGVANRYGTELRGTLRPGGDSDRVLTIGVEAARADVTSDIFGEHAQNEVSAYGEGARRFGPAIGRGTTGRNRTRGRGVRGSSEPAARSRVAHTLGDVARVDRTRLSHAVVRGAVPLLGGAGDPRGSRLDARRGDGMGFRAGGRRVARVGDAARCRRLLDGSPPADRTDVLRLRRSPLHSVPHRAARSTPRIRSVPRGARAVPEPRDFRRLHLPGRPRPRQRFRAGVSSHAPPDTRRGLPPGFVQRGRRLPLCQPDRAYRARPELGGRPARRRPGARPARRLEAGRVVRAAARHQRLELHLQPDAGHARACAYRFGCPDLDVLDWCR